MRPEHHWPPAFWTGHGTGQGGPAQRVRGITGHPAPRTRVVGAVLPATEVALRGPPRSELVTRPQRPEVWPPSPGLLRPCGSCPPDGSGPRGPAARETRPAPSVAFARGEMSEGSAPPRSGRTTGAWLSSLLLLSPVTVSSGFIFREGKEAVHRRVLPESFSCSRRRAGTRLGAGIRPGGHSAAFCQLRSRVN